MSSSELIIITNGQNCEALIVPGKHQLDVLQQFERRGKKIEIRHWKLLQKAQRKPQSIVMKLLKFRTWSHFECSNDMTRTAQGYLRTGKDSGKGKKG